MYLSYIAGHLDGQTKRLCVCVVCVCVCVSDVCSCVSACLGSFEWLFIDLSFEALWWMDEEAAVISVCV